MKRLLYVGLLLTVTNILDAQSLKPWKINLPTGKQLKSKTSTITSIKQEVMGQHIDISMNGETNDSLFVKSESNGSFKLAKTTVSLIINMSAMGKEMNFDSNKKEDMEGEMGQKMKNKIGVPIDAFITENGQVQILTSVKNDDDGGDAMTSMMSMDNDSLNIANFFLKSPGGTIKPGQSWSDSSVSPQIGIVNTYTLEKVENNIAEIKYISVTNIEGIKTANGMEIKMKMKTEGSGTLKVNAKTGLIIERKVISKINGTSEVMAMEIPMSGEITSSSVVTEL